jgi:hypothetical protein
MLDPVSPSRRLSQRVEPAECIWVYWQYDEHGEASAVQNMSLGGVFLKTPKERPIDSSVDLHLIVNEGQIRTGATVCHVIPGRGLGLAFSNINNKDRLHLLAVMDRLRSRSQVEHKQATLVQFLLRPSFSS